MPIKAEKKKAKPKAAPVNIAFTLTEQLKSYFADVVKEIKASTLDKIAELEQRNGQLSKSIGQLKNEINGANERIDEILDTPNPAATANEIALAVYNLLIASNGPLDGLVNRPDRIDLANNRIDELVGLAGSNNQVVTADIADLKDKLTKAEAGVGELCEKIKTRAGQGYVDGVEGRLRAIIRDLRADFEKRNEKIESLENELAALKSEIAELKKTYGIYRTVNEINLQSPAPVQEGRFMVVVK